MHQPRLMPAGPGLPRRVTQGQPVLQLKLHLLCPFMFPSPPMLADSSVRSARSRIEAEPRPHSAADAAAGAAAPRHANGGAQPDAGRAADHDAAVQPLPDTGDSIIPLVHLSKVVLRPLRVRGVDTSEVHPPVDPMRVAEGLCSSAAAAVQASNGTPATMPVLACTPVPAARALA